MPTSTEQILHPDRYAAHDNPARLAFVTRAADSARYEDDLGEFESRLLLTQWLGNEQQAEAYVAGWHGDRYDVFAAGALVWYSLWDDAAAANRFAKGLQLAWTKRTAGAADRRSRIDRLLVDKLPAVRLVDAPVAWPGWRLIPTVRVLH